MPTPWATVCSLPGKFRSMSSVPWPAPAKSECKRSSASPTSSPSSRLMASVVTTSTSSRSMWSAPVRAYRMRGPRSRAPSNPTCRRRPCWECSASVTRSSSSKLTRASSAGADNASARTGEFVLEVRGVLVARRSLQPRQMTRREQIVGRLVLAQDLTGDRGLVHLGGPVGEGHDLGADQHPGERHLVRHAERAVEVHRPQHDVVVHLRHRHLDRGDVVTHPAIVVVLVDLPGGAHHEQLELLDLDPAVGDLFLYDSQ